MSPNMQQERAKQQQQLQQRSFFPALNKCVAMHYVPLMQAKRRPDMLRWVAGFQNLSLATAAVGVSQTHFMKYARIFVAAVFARCGVMCPPRHTSGSACRLGLRPGPRRNISSWPRFMTRCVAGSGLSVPSGVCCFQHRSWRAPVFCRNAQATQASVSVRPLSAKTWNFSTEPGSGGKRRTRRVLERLLAASVLSHGRRHATLFCLHFAGASSGRQAAKGGGKKRQWTPGKGQEKGEWLNTCAGFIFATFCFLPTTGFQKGWGKGEFVLSLLS